MIQVKNEFGSAFDLEQPHNDEKLDDDIVANLPFRILKHWYLVTTATTTGNCRNDSCNNTSARIAKNVRRLPLPRNSLFSTSPEYKDARLYGWLQPNHFYRPASVSTTSETIQPIFVEIDDLNRVCFDRSKQYRGY